MASQVLSTKRLGAVDTLPIRYILLEVRDIPIFLEREVHIDDVSGAKQAGFRRHAMAGDVIERGIEHEREPILPLTRRARLSFIGDEPFSQVVGLHERLAFAIPQWEWLHAFFSRNWLYSARVIVYELTGSFCKLILRVVLVSYINFLRAVCSIYLR